MYVALLRGINVGGKNKVSMKELKLILEEKGYQHVQTYLNSGNILFDSESGEETVLKTELEQILFEHFHLEIPLVLLTSENYFRRFHMHLSGGVRIQSQSTMSSLSCHTAPRRK